MPLRLAGTGVVGVLHTKGPQSRPTCFIKFMIGVFMYKEIAQDRLKAAKKSKCDNRADKLVVGIGMLLDTVEPEEALKVIGAIMDMADWVTKDRNTFVVSDAYCKHLGWQPKKRIKP
jgi:hypothetical protein